MYAKSFHWLVPLQYMILCVLPIFRTEHYTVVIALGDNVFLSKIQNTAIDTNGSVTYILQT